MRVDLIKIRRMLRYVTREKERKQNKREGARNHYHDFSYRYFVFFFFFIRQTLMRKEEPNLIAFAFSAIRIPYSFAWQRFSFPRPCLSFRILECVEKEEVKFLDGLFI